MILYQFELYGMTRSVYNHISIDPQKFWVKIHRRWKIQRHSYLNCISFYSFVLRHGKFSLIIVKKINFLTKLLFNLYCDISHTSVFVRIHTQRQLMQFRDHIVINKREKFIPVHKLKRTWTWFTNFKFLSSNFCTVAGKFKSLIEESF